MEEMFITPMNLMKSIGNIGDMGNAGNAGRTVSGQEGSSVFKDVFKEAIQNVTDTDKNLAREEYLLSTGQIDDAHTVPAAAAQAQLSVELLTALRNKALEAYNEIIKITV